MCMCVYLCNYICIYFLLNIFRGTSSRHTLRGGGGEERNVGFYKVRDLGKKLFHEKMTFPFIETREKKPDQGVL